MLDDPKVLPRHREFWNTDRKHYLKQIPIYQQRGGHLAKGAYDYVKRGTESANIARDPVGAAISAMSSIQQLERARGVAPVLEALARRIVAAAYDIDLTKTEENYNLAEDELFEFKLQHPDADMKVRIESIKNRSIIETKNLPPDAPRFKRSLTLMIAQGSAMHYFFQALYHPLEDGTIVSDAIKNLPQGERLLELYKQFAYGSAMSYWTKDMASMMRSVGSRGQIGAAGWKKYKNPYEMDWTDFESASRLGTVVFEAEEGEEVPQTYGIAGNIIRAQGEIFPVLVQEGFKAMAYLIASLTTEETQESQASLRDMANMQAEVPYLQVGHQLWRLLIKIKPENYGPDTEKLTLSSYIAILCQMPVEDINMILGLLLHDMEEDARLQLNKIMIKMGYMQDPEQNSEPEEYSFDESNYDDPGEDESDENDRS